jgi:RIO kinase 1
MKSKLIPDNFDPDSPLEDLSDSVSNGQPVRLRNLPTSRAGQNARPAPRKAIPAPDSELAAIGAAESSFKFTYQASRHEEVWLTEALYGFHQQQWLDDVLYRVKGGKEATVYLCAANPGLGTDYLAAKVYRPRMFRNLKNDSLYQVGRGKLDSSGNKITNKGELHAIEKKTGFGWELTHTSWIEYEYQTLTALSQAGGDVPRPYARGNNAILMGYVGEPGNPAPTLATVELSRVEARRLFDRVIHNVELLLQANLVHGDLSAFNILYWEGEISLIDFPQVIHIAANPEALRIFQRDIARVCEYFARQGVAHNARRLADALWTSHHHELVTPVDPLYLDPEKNEDRQVWDRQAKKDR